MTSQPLSLGAGRPRAKARTDALERSTGRIGCAEFLEPLWIEHQGVRVPRIEMLRA